RRRVPAAKACAGSSCAWCEADCRASAAPCLRQHADDNTTHRGAKALDSKQPIHAHSLRPCSCVTALSPGNPFALFPPFFPSFFCLAVFLFIHTKACACI